jgi:Na+-driven multidrug efflux pump
MYLLGQFFGLGATWLAFPIGESISFVIMVTWLYGTIKNSMYEMKNRTPENSTV